MIAPGTTCQICDRPVPAGATYPLCKGCEGSAKEAGKQANDARRYGDPEHRRLPGEIASW